MDMWIVTLKSSSEKIVIDWRGAKPVAKDFAEFLKAQYPGAVQIVLISEENDGASTTYFLEG